jgi:ATP-binding cassette subfamily B protein
VTEGRTADQGWQARRVAAVLAQFARGAGVRRTVLAVVTTLVAGVAAVLVSLWLKLILDGVARHDVAYVTATAIGLALTVSAQAGASAVSGFFLAELQFSCGVQLVRGIMRASSEPPGIEHYERPEFADRIALLRQQTNYISGFLPALSEGLALTARLVLTGVLLAAIHPALLLLPVLAIPSLYAGARAERVVNAADVATAELSRLEQHLFALATTASPAKEVRIFGLGDEVVRRQRQAWTQVSDVVARAQLRAGLVRALGWVPFAAGYLGAVTLVLDRARHGQATPGDVLLVMVLASQVNAQVAQLVNLANRSAIGVRVVGRYLWLRDYARDAVARSTPEPGSQRPVPATLAQGIALHDVSFRYPGDGRDDVLSGVTLHLAAGSTVAIVGENGAGKTTLVKLLCRFYEPSSGRVTVDGLDLRCFDVAEWRAGVSAGFQDFARFELRLRESVGIGRLAAIDDCATVSDALGRVGADLRLDLEQQLGRQWKAGVDLSEGQWQKVAMARAVMRRQPVLLVLDEPTSGLDPHAEHALFELFAGVAAETARRTGSIAVFVSHRFSTVRMADTIVVLAGGRVVEQGDHASLLARDGLYAELYGIQARAYE